MISLTQPEPPIFLSASRGVCRVCHEMVPVRYVSDGEKVFLERRCPEHGVARDRIGASRRFESQTTTRARQARSAAPPLP